MASAAADWTRLHCKKGISSWLKNDRKFVLIKFYKSHRPVCIVSTDFKKMNIPVKVKAALFFVLLVKDIHYTCQNYPNQE